MRSRGSVTAYVGLGSNLGDKTGHIRAALELLAAAPGVEVDGVAPLYLTAPMGFTEQDWFINTVARVKTDLGAGELLEALLGIEAELGRVRKARWGPRIIDLDLLLHGDMGVKEGNLEVPHPRLEQRAFVVVPLADLAPELLLPGGRKAADLARELAANQEIKKVY